MTHYSDYLGKIRMSHDSTVDARLPGRTDRGARANIYNGNRLFGIQVNMK